MNYKIALVTGASSGIGRAIAETLTKKGLKVILIARSKDKLDTLKSELKKYADCHIVDCDITDKELLTNKINHLPEEFKSVDVLVNCAGLALGINAAQEADWNDWETMINVNCVAVSYLIHLLMPGMVERDCGHIINIGSIAGTYPYKGGNIYGATKAFVEQLTLNLKSDALGTAVRVSNIEPGMVSGSEFSVVRFKGDKEKASKIYENIEALNPVDIAEAVEWVLSRPANVNINRVEIMPISQAPSRTAYHKK